MHNDLIPALKTKVSALLGGDNSGHADDHVFRVFDVAMEIGKKEGADLEIVALAALLHDCDDYKIFGQDVADELSNSKTIMAELNIAPEKQQSVLNIIGNMGYSKLLQGVRPTCLEGKVVSDADMLDAMGAMGITRCLAYAINRCSTTYFDQNNWPELNLSVEEYKRPNRESDNFINHFFEKLLRLKNIMLTPSGTAMAQPRFDVMVLFLKQFFVEQGLGDWSQFLDNYLKDESLV